MSNLTEKYRLIWDISTLIIQNTYERNWEGSITILIDGGKVDFIESEVYQNITDKINELDLKDSSDNNNFKISE